MSKAPAYLLQGKNIILVLNGVSHTISKDTHIAYGKIVDALKAKDWALLEDLVEPKTAIISFGAGNVSFENGEVRWKGQKFHNALATRMVEMFQEGFPIEPMVKFMELLMKNPSMRSVDQVYGFLEKNKLPITEDGHFLAFKRVKVNYRDIHTGTIDNSVGQVVTMDRNLVDDKPDSHCSSGLHFCSESYLGSFGSSHEPVMILKISPEDVVSIPTDHNGAKGRCCKYTVVAQVTGDPKTAFSTIINTDYAAPSAKPVAKKTAKSDVSPASAWPFPPSVPVLKTPVARKIPATKPPVKPQVYDLVRARDMYQVEYTGLSLAEAREQVERNVRQKKVQLKIVKAGTVVEVK